FRSRRVHVDGERMANRAGQLSGRPHNDVHRELRSFLLAEVRARIAGDGMRNRPTRTTGTWRAAAEAVDTYLDRVWPNLTPPSFVLGLLSSPDLLAAAAAGPLTPDDVAMLAIPGDARVGTWRRTVADGALLDTADALLNGPPVTYEHIVVDEAQDLAPLQLDSIRRRSRRGAITLLGDLAQATGPWARTSWDEVVDHLGHGDVPVSFAELRMGYRLPAEVHDLVARLLPGSPPTCGRRRSCAARATAR